MLKERKGLLSRWYTRVKKDRVNDRIEEEEKALKKGELGTSTSMEEKKQPTAMQQMN